MDFLKTNWCVMNGRSQYFLVCQYYMKSLLMILMGLGGILGLIVFDTTSIKEQLVLGLLYYRVFLVQGDNLTKDQTVI